ncbi:hypothetical protein BpHYR1_009465 [Brachionus plicatilis]|uniref:Uncharacterized protein n=1 Tax=Brachionus plicatilis TaxID=10195 RepID=A0A3M7PRD9_BRAPC|nr:hypothetical protein BpHYR1_009465 [Brachionus plicatilis]
MYFSLIFKGSKKYDHFFKNILNFLFVIFNRPKKDQNSVKRKANEEVDSTEKNVEPRSQLNQASLKTL